MPRQPPARASSAASSSAAPASDAAANPPAAAAADADTRKKKHVCATCGRGFTTSGHLARHGRVHTGERNHKCPYPGCETRCSRQDNLQQHYRVHLSPRSRNISTSAARAAMGRAANEAASVPPRAPPPAAGTGAGSESPPPAYSSRTTPDLHSPLDARLPLGALSMPHLNGHHQPHHHHHHHDALPSIAAATGVASPDPPYPAYVPRTESSSNGAWPYRTWPSPPGAPRTAYAASPGSSASGSSAASGPPTPTPAFAEYQAPHPAHHGRREEGHVFMEPAFDPGAAAHYQGMGYLVGGAHHGAQGGAHAGHGSPHAAHASPHAGHGSAHAHHAQSARSRTPSLQLPPLNYTRHLGSYHQQYSSEGSGSGSSSYGPYEQQHGGQYASQQQQDPRCNFKDEKTHYG